MENMTNKMTNYRWVICAMLFFATTVNYLDRQVLSLTYPGMIEVEFHWDESMYGRITAAFSIVYAICGLFAGRFVDWVGTKKGYLWAIGVWSVGACAHALCGVLTEWVTDFDDKFQLISATGDAAVLVATVGMYFFIAARCVLALGEAGNFPAAIKATAGYFPKKDRAFATSIFNSGSSVGALIAPLTIPVIAKHLGWEMAFILIGGLGFVWMGFWIFLYHKPQESPFVNKAELDYINQDDNDSEAPHLESDRHERKMSLLQCFKYKQTWAYAFGKFMTDGVWWFFLFWTPKYLHTHFDILPTSSFGMTLIFVLYLITMLSIFGGKLPTIIINRTGLDPYAARMRAMFVFALFPLLGILAQPLAGFFGTPWVPVILIGILGAAHQSWSANIFTTVGDMFPKSAIATITGIGGLAGGLGSYLINRGSGELFTYAGETNMHALGFEGKPAGYMIIFCVCAVAYIIGWAVMKTLVPRYKPINPEE